jgi:hypothetical protein
MGCAVDTDGLAFAAVPVAGALAVGAAVPAADVELLAAEAEGPATEVGVPVPPAETPCAEPLTAEPTLLAALSM